MANYNLYGLIGLEIDSGGRRGYARYFDNEYRRIATQANDKTPDQTISLKIVSRLPDTKAGDISRQASFKKLFSYSYLVRGLDTPKSEIFFQAHPIGKLYMNAIGVFIQAQVLEPVMYLKLAEAGVLFMHASGVARNGKGYLLPAQGGTGKTTFSIALLENGFKLLGDDLLLVDTNSGIVYPYPRPLHLFTYNVNSLRGAKVPLKYKLAICAKDVLRFGLERIMRTDFLISTRVHADEIFDGDIFAEPAKYAGICFLLKSGEPLTMKKLTVANRPAIANQIIDSADLNQSLYTMLGACQTKTVRALEEKLVMKLLGQFDHITYIIPRRLQLADLKPLIHEVFDD